MSSKKGYGKNKTVPISMVETTFRIVGHDLNNEHTAAIGILEGVVNEAKNGNGELEIIVKKVEQAIKCIQKASQIVSEEGSQFRSVEFNLAEEVEKIVRGYQEQKLGVRFVVDLKESAIVKLPYYTLKRVLANLKRNALVAMEKQEIKLSDREIRFSTELKEGYIRLIVENPGKMKVPRPFKEGESDNGVSKGLGLPYVRRLLRYADASIRNVNKKGVVRFIITFPVSKCSVP